MIKKHLKDKRGLAVVGLGYVGLPLAVEFAKKFSNVIAFDVNKERINNLKKGIDINYEVDKNELKKGKIEFTSDFKKISKCSFIIIAVPTPVDVYKVPDLSFLMAASKMVGQNLTKGSIVVYESTVFPGATEELCAPILEKYSKLKHGVEFKIGYSPERVNPGDKKHRLSKIIKIVSGCDDKCTDEIAEVYSKIISAGIYKASSIKVAEGAKVIENIQRDINIALINELSIIFGKMNISTKEVLEAASTKWNFLHFEPGLVGGHCIGVDPYYLTFKAQELGYHPHVILSGRRINDYMSEYIAEQTIKQMIAAGKNINQAKVLILGITFKENVRDIRNSRIPDIVGVLKENGLHVIVYDPLAIKEKVEEEYGIELTEDINSLADIDCIIMAVKHKEFLKHNLKKYRQICGASPVFIDVKNYFAKEEIIRIGFSYWSL